ncbi:MAG: hypothetical protein JEY97_01795 [Bacteroidales bacterium]|nr:hypothetical protein [Bacteroidales bacterium]
MTSAKKHFFLNKNYFIYFINSTAAFISTYFIISIFRSFTSILIAYECDINSLLFLNRIEFLVPQNSSLWTFDTTLSVFFSGPFFSFLLGAILSIYYLTKRKKNSFFNIFLFWAFINAFGLFFSSVLADLITSTGVVYALNSMNFSHAVRVIIFISVIYLMIHLGALSIKVFVFSSDSCFIKTFRKRIIYLISVILLPWFIGSLIILLIITPLFSLYYIFLLSLMILFLISVLYPKNYYLKTENKIHNKNKINWIFIISNIVLIFVLRYYLNSGINLFANN